MKKINLETLKKLQLDILEFVDKFCREKNINYWLNCGTLLGAIRHKGYIPWDDDVDLGMLRDDYDKFRKEFNESSDRYKFVCIENSPNFYVPFGKVCDTKTVLYEPDEKGFKSSVCIDVFVYDNAPDDDLALNKMFDKRDRLRRAYYLQNGQNSNNGSGFKKIAKKMRYFFYKHFFSKRFLQKLIINSKKYSNKETSRVGNFTGYDRMSCDKKVFSSFIDVEFEGRYFKAPVGYDEWLKSYYGDYMKLPPEEKRVSHHHFVAYFKTDEE